MTDPPTQPPVPPTPPVPPGTVRCGVCRTEYEPTTTETLILAGLGPVTDWENVVAGYATDTGWFRRPDGRLVCDDHVDRIPPERS